MNKKVLADLKRSTPEQKVTGALGSEDQLQGVPLSEGNILKNRVQELLTENSLLTVRKCYLEGQNVLLKLQGEQMKADVERRSLALNARVNELR